MRTVTAYDLGAFAAQAATRQNTAHGLGAHVVNVKTAADYERVRSGGGRFPGVMPDEPAPAGAPMQQAGAPVRQAASPELARKETAPFVIKGRVNADQIAARDRAVAGLPQPSLDKEYAASGFSGFRLKPVGAYGQASGGATFPLEYQIVATGPDGQEQLINTIKSRNAQTEPNLNPSNINKMVQQGAQRLGMKAGPKPPAPRPQAQPKPDIIQEHLNRWKDSYKSPTGAPNPNIPPPVPQPAPAPAAPAPVAQAPARPAPAPVAPATPPPAPAQPDQIGPTAPITMDNALGGPNGGQPSPPEPEPEAGPNGPNAGNYVPPAAPEPAPVSGLQPPEMLPKINDQSILAQRINFENSQKQEEYDQALKQQQEVGNNSADYPTQAPAPASTPDSILPVPQKQYNPEDAAMVAKDEAAHQAMLQNPAQSAVQTGTLMSNQSTARGAPAASPDFKNLIPGLLNSESNDANPALTLGQRFAGPASYASPAAQFHAENLNSNLIRAGGTLDGANVAANKERAQAYSMPDMRTADAARQAQRAEEQTGPNGPNAGNYVPPAAPEPEPVSALQPPEMLPKINDQSILAQHINFENSRRQEEYDQTLKQRQDVGNDPADYPTQAPAPAQPGYDQKVVDGIFDNITNPATAYSQQEVDAISDKLRIPTTSGTSDSILPSPSINDLGFSDPSYVPPTATPTSEPTYSKKPLTRAQQSVGNVGAFSQAGVAKTRKQEQQQAKSAPAAAAPKAPSVPVTPPQPPIPTPELPKPTPTPVPPPEPAPTPAPAAPQYRPSAPAAPAYRPPAQAAPAPRQTIGGGLFGRRRR